MERRINLPIRYKLLTSSLLIATVVVSIITVAMANLFHTDKKAYIHDITLTMAEHTAQLTGKTLLGYRDRLSLFARFILDRELKQDAKLQLLQGMFQDFPDIIAVTLIDENEKDVMIYDAGALESVGATKMDLRVFRIANPMPLDRILANEEFLENSTLTDGRPVMTLAIPYFRTNHPPVVIAGVISMERLIKSISQSKAFETLLVFRNGTLFSHVSGQTLINHRKLDWLPQLNDTEVRNGINQTREYSKDGREYIGGIAPVGFGNLLAIAQIPKEVAFLTARELLGNLTGLALLLLLGSGVAGLFLAYKITKPIERLSLVTDQVREGNFNIEIARSTNDEIGDLADSFNSMARGLLEREQKLRDANIALIQSEKLSAFGQLSAGIAHEVKNPLTGILGYAQLSKRKLAQDDPLRQNLEIIEKETKRCRDIINNLMRFARSEKTEYMRIDINKVLHDTVRVLNHQLGLKNVRVKGALARELPAIMANPNHLQQVFMNLLINAQQAMGDSGGLIVIETRLQDPAHILIQVRDNGPGIAPDLQAKIFEPFFTTKKAGEGTGLGLSVSYGIIRDHGGSISVGNNPEKGATFSILLPAATTDVASAPAGDTMGAAAGEQAGDAQAPLDIAV